MTLAPYIRAMGRGPSRARSLTRDEARDAFAQILAGTADPAAIGALFMLMRYRGETAGEIAGFAEAARARLTSWADAGAALDWPSYAAGRSRGLPWFLIAARLLAQAGHPVLLHGWNSHQNAAADVRSALSDLKIPVVETPQAARTMLRRTGIVYAPLEALDPALLGLLRLREVLGLRSSVNTVCRMLNPARARAMVQGVFHPSYRALQQDAGRLLGETDLMVLKGGGGEFERNPAKTVELYGLRGGEPVTIRTKPLLDGHRRLADEVPDPSGLRALWSAHGHNPHAEAIVAGTTAGALLALAPGLDLEAAEAQAGALWQSHLRAMAS